ncbi:MAG: 16S rRNA (cytidine(1402)-2'-O)-methyltransferase, partial [Bacteroidia bacterium]|nr:16S rRNA (cytidine(1402)-2'-O)-methyltransferase [Bacteroidia bacterium]
LQEETRTMIFYESPHRIVKLLQELAFYFVENRLSSVSREISKKFESTQRGTLGNLKQYYERLPTIKGEFVVIVGGKE